MNRRLKTAATIIGVIGTWLAWLALNIAAKADRSLADVVNDSETCA